MTREEDVICTVTMQIDGAEDDCKRLHRMSTGLLLDLAGLERLDFTHEDNILGICVREHAAPYPPRRARR